MKAIKVLLTPRPPDNILIHYKTLRKWVGVLGIALPLVLWLGAIIFGDCSELQPSISHYYYTNMREVFVGVLCAVSLFLFTYKGPSKLDGILTNAAALFCLGVALFPTNIGTNSCQAELKPFLYISFHEKIHLTCAALFFVILACMSLFIFTLSDKKPADRTPNKFKRNVIFRICGIVMLAAMAAIVIYFISNGDKNSPVVFAMEATALFAFGVSWLTKGEAIFGD